ncbi:very short patch repair endonuclease [Cohnella thermotolerans]|uniref:very short patch repair endonuclease n=1 Tax=Cohnella thermotolerans TaxID=329858 RepID=UPI001F0ABDEE|nr:very short patch repair endonuclease [Cohnella thermotolerans]
MALVDRLSKEKRSDLMRAVKSKKSLIENSVTHELWKRGLRFRRNVKNLKGKPDIAIKKDKIGLAEQDQFKLLPTHEPRP